MINQTTQAPPKPGKIDKPERFNLGRIHVTPGAQEAFVEAYRQFGELAPSLANMELLERHVTGDWGELDAHDKRVNERAIKQGDRILSVYFLPNMDAEHPLIKGAKLYIITEYNRAATTVLLASEY